MNTEPPASRGRKPPGLARFVGWVPSPVASKVPEITVLFWLIKVVTTGGGESASDAMVHELGPVVAVAIGAIMFLASFGVQLAQSRYRTWAYWTCVAMVGVFGTMAADVLHVGLGIPYLVSAAFYFVVLAAVFALWFRLEGTLSIHSITTSRREIFYWATVLATFALGTAVGDLTATTFHLGYLGSTFLFAGVICVPALAYAIWRRHAVFFFWFSYVLTRPLGASLADYLGFGPARGGVGVGHAMVTLMGAIVFVALVSILAIRERSTRVAP